jgi:hypothetical protein
MPTCTATSFPGEALVAQLHDLLCGGRVRGGTGAAHGYPGVVKLADTFKGSYESIARTISSCVMTENLLSVKSW